MRIDLSLSCAGLPAVGLPAGGDSPAPAPAIAAPVVSTASLAGDTRPTYSIDFVEPYPGGGGIGDTLEGRWGTSLVEMAAMTPESVVIGEGMFIDGDDPFRELGDFAEAQSVGETIYFSFRVVRGSDESDWSNTGTLLRVDGTMDAPGLADLTGQDTGTRVWSASFTVSGLASGAWARLEGTGPIRVGGVTVYEAGEQVLVQNGAELEFGVDTSALEGIPVANVVSNRGVELETFSATTAVVTVTENRVVSEGDSISAAGSTGYNSLFDAAYPALDYIAMAVGGSGLTGSAPSMELRKPTALGHAPEVLTFLIGTNDLANTTLYPTTQDFIDAVFAYAADFRAMGTKVVVGTVLPKSGGSATLHNTRRATVNPALKAAVGTEIDAVADFDATVMGLDATAANTAYYGDGVHPTALGHATLYPNYKGAVNAMLGVANSVTAFTLGDQAGAALSTVYSSATITISGLNYGESKPYTVTGGEVSKNGGSFSSSGGTVVNGDALQCAGHRRAARQLR